MVRNPNRYYNTVEEFDRYTVVYRRIADNGDVLGEFGVLCVAPMSLLCQIRVSIDYPSIGLIKDCLRLCNKFDKMGYKLYAMSVPELRRFFSIIGFKEYGIMEDGYIRWIYDGQEK